MKVNHHLEASHPWNQAWQHSIGNTWRAWVNFSLCTAQRNKFLGPWGREKKASTNKHRSTRHWSPCRFVACPITVSENFKNCLARLWVRIMVGGTIQRSCHATSKRFTNKPSMKPGVLKHPSPSVSAVCYMSRGVAPHAQWARSGQGTAKSPREFWTPVVSCWSMSKWPGVFFDCIRSFKRNSEHICCTCL